MADIKKVLNGLKCCAEDVNEFGDCLSNDCPYKHKQACCSHMARDALELLKSQQPRVLTLEEARNHEVVWAEDRQNDDVSICVVQRNMNDSKLYKYGVQWRVWSVRPTDEQRKAVKWDD